MNYLAHAYLSFRNPDILAGNMISDFVKGKKINEYPVGVINGIRLHRKIDTFTDTHPCTREMKSFFKKDYRLYAGAFADIVYDHFLANDPHEFSGALVLQTFAEETYAVLRRYENIFPDPFRRMFPFMQEHDWLFNYRTRWGIGRSFEGLVRRAAYLEDAGSAIRIFEKEYASFLPVYSVFFQELKAYTIEQMRFFYILARPYLYENN